jgi:hypothetical protein
MLASAISAVSSDRPPRPRDLATSSIRASSQLPTPVPCRDGSTAIWSM